MALLALVLATMLLPAAAVPLTDYDKDPSLHRSAPHSWLNRGWRTVRFGMGPGDVAKRIRNAPGTPAFAAVDRMYWVVVPADPLGGKLVEARFDFFQDHLTGIYLKQYRGPHQGAPLYDEVVAWFNVLKADTTKGFGKARCSGDRLDTHFCYWNLPNSDAMAAALMLKRTPAEDWEVTLSFRATDEEAMPWMADEAPNPLAAPKVECLGCGQTLFAEADDAAMSMGCSGYPPFDRLTCQFVHVAIEEEYSDAMVAEEINQVMKYGEEKLQAEACKEVDSLKDHPRDESTDSQRRLSKIRDQLAADICTCSGDGCAFEIFKSAFPLLSRGCNIYVGPTLRLEMMRTGPNAWHGRSTTEPLQFDDAVSLEMTGTHEFKMAWTRTDYPVPGKPPEAKTSKWSTTGAKKFLPKCAFYEFSRGL